MGQNAKLTDEDKDKGKKFKQELQLAYNRRIDQSVRLLMNFTYSLVVSVMSTYLLAKRYQDIGSHAGLYFIAFGYQVYSAYWSFGLRAMRRSCDHKFYVDSNIKIFIAFLFRSLLIVMSIRALSFEIATWKSPFTPMLRDIKSGPWKSSATIQARAFVNQMLRKNSSISSLMTENLLVYELPHIISSLFTVLNFKYNYSDHYHDNDPSSLPEEPDASQIGTAAWRDEHGYTTNTDTKAFSATLYSMFTKFHLFLFAFISLIGGGMALHKTVLTKPLIYDTGYMIAAFSEYGLALYETYTILPDLRDIDFEFTVPAWLVPNKMNITLNNKNKD